MQAQAVAKDGSATDLAFKQQYDKNIKLTKINGVYIPASLEECFKRLNKLSPPSAISQFKAAPEVEVCQKLHFGLGRWIMVNWNFYEGSRISHQLKQKGVLHPDDMVQFILRMYHRSLNGLDMEENSLIEELSKSRKIKTKEALGL